MACPLLRSAKYIWKSREISACTKKVYVGFATQDLIERLEKDKKVSPLQKMEFFTECDISKRNG